MNSRTQKAVVATVFIGADSSPMDDCHIRFVDELFRIEKNIKLDERNGDMERRIVEGSPVKRKLSCLRKKSGKVSFISENMSVTLDYH